MLYVMGIGRLTADPEVVVTGKGNKIVRFTLAEQRTKDSADFDRMSVFDPKLCEFAEKYLKKGSAIQVVGQMTDNNYQKDGKTVYQKQIAVDDIRFVNMGGRRTENAEAAEKQPEPEKEPEFMDVPADDEDGIPFA